MNVRRALLWSVGLAYTVVAFGVVGMAGWLWWQSRIPGTTPSTPSLHSQLSGSNPAFVQAEAAVKQGHYRQAVALYRQALAATSDPAQQAALDYALAASEDLSGDHLDAIPLLKQVAADTAAPDYLRAYAAQYLGRMALANNSRQDHAAVMAEIFKDPPYKEMLVPDDESLSIRHLFDYATSFYPAAIAELRIADWYVKYMRFNNLSTTTDPGRQYVAIAQQKLSSADLEISQTLTWASATMIPEALNRRAVVLSELAHDGVVPYDVAIAAYRDAIGSYPTYDTIPGDDWGARFNYAGFLAHTYGKSKVAELHDVISPLYAIPTIYGSTTLAAFLKGLIAVKSTATPQTSVENNKLRARQIGALDEGFKKLLVSLGWSAGEFQNVPEDMSHMAMPAGAPMSM